MPDEINVLNNMEKPALEVPKEQERINVSNIPPKSIGQRELDDTILTETSTNTITNKTLTSPVINTPTGDVATLTGTQTLTNKTLTSPVINTAISGTAVATGAEVTTGTDNTKIVTPKAIGDAGVNTRLSSKIITSTRDTAAASENVSYTGVGFTPTSIHAYMYIDSLVGGSVGFSDSAKNNRALTTGVNGSFYAAAKLVSMETSSGNIQSAIIASYDSDGFTLTWTKTSNPTGTAGLIFLCYR